MPGDLTQDSSALIGLGDWEQGFIVLLASQNKVSTSFLVVPVQAFPPLPVALKIAPKWALCHPQRILNLRFRLAV